MGASFLPVLIFSALWGVVGIVLPFMVPRSPHKSVIQVRSKTESKILRVDLKIFVWQVVLMLTGACCWLFWLCCYMSQMNPLIGPVLETKALFAMKREWGGADED